MSGPALRIAMLCESYDSLGGVAQIVEELASEFARAGHRAAIISNPPRSAGLQRPANPLVEQIRLELPRAKPPSWRHPERWLTRPRPEALVDCIRRWRPDILNVHGGLRDRFPAVLEACRASGVALVQSIHLVPEAMPEHAIAAIQAARAITFPSTAVKDAFERFSREARRAQIIRGGANLDAALSAQRCERARPYVFCASRLDLRHKAVDALISGFAAISQEFPQIDLLIAGDGPDRAKIARMVEETGLGGRIELMMMRPHDELWGLYKGAVLFAMLSRMAEGLPLVFFEAMACGTPVVATRSGGTPELVIDRETGLLVERNEPAEVANALRLMLRDATLRARLGANGYQLVAAQYTWRIAAASFVELYRQCLR